MSLKKICVRKLMNNSVFGKTMENVRRHQDINVKPKYNEKAKLCYMNTDSLVINIFTEYFFEDINNDVERWFDTSNYDENDKRPIQIGVNKKVIGMFKGELGGKITEECTYSKIIHIFNGR